MSQSAQTYRIDLLAKVVSLQHLKLWFDLINKYLPIIIFDLD